MRLAIRPLLVLRGGSNAGDYLYTPGKVATVDFEDGFLAGNSQLREVTFDSFDLTTSVSKIVDKLPSTISGLWLMNNLLTSLPSEVANFRSLDTLNAVGNSITKVDQSHEINLLRVLYLDDNSFKEIPPAVFNHTKLEQLYVVPLCKSNGTTGDVSQMPGSSTSDTSGSSSSSVPTILGIIAGVVVVVAVIGFAVWWRRRGTSKSDGTSTTNHGTDYSAGANHTNGGYTALWNDRDLLAMVASGKLRPSLSPTCPPEIAKLVDACWSLRPADRPSAPEAAYALRSYRKSLGGLFI
ncbi:hypothetical protein PybrP1_009871 [[Pythium] brassicae (nom. inval.)]|nr:hypothetical protein PybrP1_009871 [[Pythium] brassicae (nom. inval.)]